MAEWRFPIEDVAKAARAVNTLGRVMNEMELQFAAGPATHAHEQCEMAIVYADETARERAIQLCGRLAARFRMDPKFEFSWWNVRYLKDPQIAELAAQVAARADLLLFSSSGGEPQRELKNWIRSWLPRRRGQGALVAWVNRSGKAKTTQLELYLEDVAEQGEMDFLPLIAPAAA